MQKIPVHQLEHHYPAQCVLCHHGFNAEHTYAELGRSNRVAYTAFDILTLGWGSLSQPGITVVNTRHTYSEYNYTGWNS
jgi:hypothetical protein